MDRIVKDIKHLFDIENDEWYTDELFLYDDKEQIVEANKNWAEE